MARRTLLFLLFQLGKDRYALEASRVIEVLPLLTLKHLPQAPLGVVGMFNYRGQPVPAVDLSLLTTGRAAEERLSTRIVIINYPDRNGRHHLLGLVAERATEMMRKDENEFVNAGLEIPAAPYLGPVLMDPRGPIQWILEQRLLSEPVRESLFRETIVLRNEGN
jgi:chemotaxis-related protein WspB